MKISFFFRKPSENYHSIEEQFFAIQKHLPSKINHNNIFAKYNSKGIINRIKISLHAARNQSDINHITGDINFISLFLNKSKTILTVHDIGSAIKGNFIKQKIIKYFWFTLPFKKVKYITVISEFTKQEILTAFKIPQNKIIVIPDCVSSIFTFSEYNFNSETPRILHIGTKSNKNLTNLIKAVSDINCKLIIVGKLTSEQTKLLNIYNINFENFINIDTREMAELYKKSDIVSFVTLYEGFGVPILEAQATGRPLITSNIKPHTDTAGNAALFVSPNSVEEINNGIKKIISDQNFRKKIIETGKINAEKYSGNFVASKYIYLYNQIKNENNT